MKLLFTQVKVKVGFVASMGDFQADFPLPWLRQQRRINYVNICLTDNVGNDVLLIKVNNNKGICTNFTSFVFICLVPFKKSECIRCVLLFVVWKIFPVHFLNCLAAVRSFFLAVKAKPHHLRVLFYFLTAFLIAVN